MELTASEKQKIRDMFHKTADMQADLVISMHEQLLKNIPEGGDTSFVSTVIDNVMKSATADALDRQKNMFSKIKGGLDREQL